MNGKSPDAFRTISEVADWLGVNAHVLRFWESKFTQIKPVKRAGGRRYYRRSDMELLGGIRKLLYEDGMTIKGAQKVLREQGLRAVAALSKPVDDDQFVDEEALEETAPEALSPSEPRQPPDTLDAAFVAQAITGRPAPEKPRVSARAEPAKPRPAEMPLFKHGLDADGEKVAVSPDTPPPAPETTLAGSIEHWHPTTVSAEALAPIHARLLALRERMGKHA